MRLAHLHLPGLTSYHHAAHIQEALLQRYFHVKDLMHKSKFSGLPSSRTVELPDPTVITAEFQPVYTFGRRQLNTVSEHQRHLLEDNGRATVVEAQRGGQVTYHGPGQLVAYPIIDLRRHKITPRHYIRLLEDTVIAVCRGFGVPAVETTDDPGVWAKGGQHKICAVGVQVRRGITSHGIGLNITDREAFLSWGFSRIVACGLEGKHVTWLTAHGAGNIRVEDVGPVFVKTLAERLRGIDTIYHTSEQDLRDREDSSGAP